jgi:2-oxoglutarate dehydrogenase E2 component (dihydrolipoamide succinyltransferase)
VRITSAVAPANAVVIAGDFVEGEPMPTEVVMPQMGESVFEGTVTKWLKQPGERVERDQPLLEISTDKVDTEIPAPTSGILKEIKVPVGATVQVNAVLGVIDESATPAEAKTASAARPSTGTSAKPAAATTVPASAPAPTLPARPAPAAAAAAAPASPPKASPQPVASAAATEVVMPQMGESIFEGTITRWMKNVGDRVGRDEPLFEISTDKVDAEIPSPAAGVLREIKAPAGKTVQVNQVVAVIAAEAGAAAPVQAPPARAAVQAPAAAEAEEVRSSPLVRRLAQEHGVDLRQVAGSGGGGRITKEDILSFVERAQAAPVSAPAAPAEMPPLAPAAAPTPASKFAGVPGTIEPMSPMRKRIAEHMVLSKRTSAHVHGVFEIDFTRIVKLREKMKERFQEATGLKLTYTPFFARAVAHGLRAWPIVNSSVEGESIHYKREINLGIAVALDWGLIVPVVKNADELSFVGLQRAITDLGERARSKRLKPEEVQGGTFTITNPGIFGAKFGMPIINQPQVAILGVGAIYKTPAVITDQDGNDSIGIRSVCHLSIGYDHRVIDGAVADQFMVVVKNYLENWKEPLL